MKEENIYTIGEVAHLLKISIKDIRYFEYDKLISPSHEGEYEWNLYNNNDIETLKFILSMKVSGFTSEEIKDELYDN